MIKQKYIALLLCFSIIFSGVFMLNIQQAKAWPVSITAANMVPETMGSVGTLSDFSFNVAKWSTGIWQGIMVTALKVATLLAVQKATSLIIGGAEGDTMIRDFNEYLYVSPQQKAMAQMNSFFNTVSRGRLSYLNYEGIGPNYDAYLVAQARQAIGGQQFVTNLQDQVTDPRQVFAAGNMKGIMTYMQCANNVACYTLVSSARYEKELAKAQEIAKNENVGGFVPRKKNGRITSPAALAQNALLQMDQLGTDIIMSADAQDGAPAATAQIAQGAAISIGSRAANYYISDDKGKQMIRDKNDEFPFSLGYSLNGGIGISVGGATFNTGSLAANLQVQIGNVCATMAGALDGTGAIVDIKGRKYNCKTKAEVNTTAPSGSITAPSINSQ